MILRQHFTSLTWIESLTAEIELLVVLEDWEKGLQRMNIFLSEKGSLFTEVALLCSMSITWKLRLLEI